MSIASINRDGAWPGRGSDARVWTLAAVLAAVTWNLWELRATVLPVQYMNDSSLHEQMTRFATAEISAAHDPLTSWFPYLGLGSPQFLHYQSTPSIVTGLAGLVVGPDTAFRWSLYLLWCLWPVAIYCSARLFGLRRPAAAFAGVVAPLLSSVQGIGYEQHAYVFTGFGVWTQLWGSWALPFAWALSWRAIADRRFIAPAAALVALTAALHYETGYLAFMAVVIMPVLIVRGIWARLARAAVLLAAALLAAGWVVVPLLRYARWAAINQALAAGPSASGFGARTTLDWLVTGRVLDYGHLPVVSLLAAVGLVVVLRHWRQAGAGRALVVLLCAALALAFGRTTFGSLTSLIPGGTDVFFRRFLMGSQLAAIYLAGLGAASIAGPGTRLAASCATFLSTRRLTWLTWLTWVPAATMMLAGLAYLSPAWRFLDSYDARNSADIGVQRLAQAAEGPQVDAVIALIRQHGGGRAYAGSPTNGGGYFTVGFVPMYTYLDSADIDEIGYTLRTASLMSQPENNFAPANPGDYSLMGIRYVIMPAGQAWPVPPPPGAIMLLRDASFRVFELPGNSYFTVADTVGSITADRADVGRRTLSYLRSSQPGQGRYLTVGYAGARPAPPTLRGASRPGKSAGMILTEHADLANGRAGVTVRLRRRAVVVLSASFDPGWSATIDGHPAAVQMTAPALVAVAVPPGTHRIAFSYKGFGDYPQLLVLAGLDLLAVALLSRRGKKKAIP